jgi:hypothetical protein
MGWSRGECLARLTFTGAARGPSTAWLDQSRSVNLLAGFNQVLQINFRPPPRTLIRWVQRIYHSGFLLPIPSPPRSVSVRLHNRHLFYVTASNCFREHTQQLVMVPSWVNHPCLVHLLENCHVHSRSILSDWDNVIRRNCRVQAVPMIYFTKPFVATLELAPRRKRFARLIAAPAG